ncbi:MAG: F0F1 ATP synthase subunit alpha [Clostridiales Family XIII bacterium]|jgi:F-type H+-transporting ATPase subunit alpha|nr:F0F1 ATP synthase subunit alpha [Clostridiales Family XIII bacterium]
MSGIIQDIVNRKIEAIKGENNVYDMGKVVRVSNYILEAGGLDEVGYFERVRIGDKAEGYVSRIGRTGVTVEVVKKHKPVYVGDEVTATGEPFRAAFSEDYPGHIVDIFGEDKLSGNKFENLRQIPAIAPNIPIMDRTSVERPLYTGICGIDLLYPIGRGQRQLIIGDKKTGKTQLALDAIVNRKNETAGDGPKPLCIYIALGKSKKTVKEIYNALLQKGAMSYTFILTAFQEDCAPALFLTPQAGLSMAVEFMQKGRDVLVVIDDLTQHANVYREISLLAGKVPGRDAYPPDIFYTHASMLELGCQHKSGGSVTVLPIVETRGGDITDYIATNIISITDGQIVTSAKAFEKGQRPAIDFGLSVSRLGGAVQTAEMKALGTAARRELLSYLETREVFELANVDEMSPEMRAKIQGGRELMNRMNQYIFDPVRPEEMKERFGPVVETLTAAVKREAAG